LGTLSKLKLEFGNVGWGKPEYLEKKLSEHRRKPTTNSAHI